MRIHLQKKRVSLRRHLYVKDPMSHVQGVILRVYLTTLSYLHLSGDDKRIRSCGSKTRREKATWVQIILKRMLKMGYDSLDCIHQAVNTVR
jgi:hypothetical protein